MEVEKIRKLKKGMMKMQEEEEEKNEMIKIGATKNAIVYLSCQAFQRIT